MLVRLWRGAVGVMRPRATAGGVAIETDLAIASARSIAWAVTDGEETAVFVRRGRVAAAVSGGAAALEPGERVEVGDGLGPIRRSGPALVEALERRLGFAWRRRG